jgi:predicted porin
MGGLTARAEYAVGEVAGSTSSGSTATTVIPTVVAKAVGLSYNNGPLSLGGAYTTRNIAGFDNNHYTVGGAYKFGDLKGFVAYADERQATASTIDTETKYSWIGASYLITPQLEATYAYYRVDLTGISVATSGKKDMNVVGATYAFSKRTNFYANLDVSKLGGALRIGPATATPQNDQTGVSVGINHLF